MLKLIQMISIFLVIIILIYHFHTAHLEHFSFVSYENIPKTLNDGVFHYKLKDIPTQDIFVHMSDVNKTYDSNPISYQTSLEQGNSYESEFEAISQETSEYIYPEQTISPSPQPSPTPIGPSPTTPSPQPSPTPVGPSPATPSPQP